MHLAERLRSRFFRLWLRLTGLTAGSRGRNVPGNVHSPSLRKNAVGASARARHWLLRVVGGTMGLTSCGDSSPSAPPDTQRPVPVPTNITITPPAATLDALGSSVQLAATVHDQFDSAILSARVAWRSTNPSLVTVDADGLATAMRQGRAMVVATSGSASGSAAITVAPEVTSVALDGDSVVVHALHDTIALTGEARDRNGHPVEGVRLAWRSSDVTVVTVDDTGRLTSLSNGASVVTASDGTITGSIPVRVRQRATRIELHPEQTVFPLAWQDTIRSPLILDAWDANGYGLPFGLLSELTLVSSDPSITLRPFSTSNGPTAWVEPASFAPRSVTITAGLDDLEATSEVLIAPFDGISWQFAQTAPWGAPVIRGRPGLFRMFIVAEEFATLSRGPKLDVVLRNDEFVSNLGVHTLDRPVPQSLFPDSVGVTIDVPVRAGTLAANRVVIESHLLPTVGADDLPLEGDLRAGQPHYVVPHRTRLAELELRPHPEPPIPHLVVRAIVHDGNVNHATVSRADSLTSGPYLHDEWNALTDLTPLSSLYLSKHPPLYVSHDPDEISNMSRTLDALGDAWFAECYWFFGVRCPSWYYFGITDLPDWWGVARIANVASQVRGTAAIAGFHQWTIAHEVAHLLLLNHAPCGGAPDPDTGYPYADGSIGRSPGYVHGRLRIMVPSTTGDYMSYCRRGLFPPVWVSDYHFKKIHRNLIEVGRGVSETVDGARGERGSVLLIGGGRYDRKLRLDPAFVARGWPSLPSREGPYEVAGYGRNGDVIFRYRLDMDVYWDSPTGDGSFRIGIPTREAWRESLARIVLSGPEGAYVMGRDTEEPKTWVVDTSSGALRAVLHGRDLVSGWEEELRSGGAGDLLVLTSRGVPDAAMWSSGLGERMGRSVGARWGGRLLQRQW